MMLKLEMEIEYIGMTSVYDIVDGLMIVLNDISKTCQIHFYRQFVAGIYA
jgi:hypothetical protein